MRSVGGRVEGRRSKKEEYREKEAKEQTEGLTTVSTS